MRRMRNWASVVCALLLAVAVAAPVRTRAQENPPARVDVFVAQDPQAATARVYFMDPLSGLSTVVNVEGGENFTLVGDYVLYEKTRTGAIMRANATGTLEPHPFIRSAVDTRSLQWVVSPDRMAIAWVQTNTAGVSQAYVAWADGRDLRQLPISTPSPPLELAPIALTNGMAHFFYDAAHPAGPLIGTPYMTYAHVAEYNLLDEVFYPLPLEPNCACGAAVTPDGRIFARLEADRGEGPFALHVWDLPTKAEIRIPAPDLPYRMAGDLILNDRGTFAVYSAAAGAGAEAGQELYALVLVDVVAQEQSVVLAPGPVRYQPLRFIDDDSALLLAGANQTYKLNLQSNEKRRVSNNLYLGSITGRFTE
jgi:hypothetical protein